MKRLKLLLSSSFAGMAGITVSMPVINNAQEVRDISSSSQNELEINEYSNPIEGKAAGLTVNNEGISYFDGGHNSIIGIPQIKYYEIDNWVHNSKEMILTDGFEMLKALTVKALYWNSNLGYQDTTDFGNKDISWGSHITNRWVEDNGWHGWWIFKIHDWVNRETVTKDPVNIFDAWLKTHWTDFNNDLEAIKNELNEELSNVIEYTIKNDSELTEADWEKNYVKRGLRKLGTQLNQLFPKIGIKTEAEQQKIKDAFEAPLKINNVMTTIKVVKAFLAILPNRPGHLDSNSVEEILKPNKVKLLYTKILKTIYTSILEMLGIEHDYKKLNNESSIINKELEFKPTKNILEKEIMLKWLYVSSLGWVQNNIKTASVSSATHTKAEGINTNNFQDDVLNSLKNIRYHLIKLTNIEFGKYRDNILDELTAWSVAHPELSATEIKALENESWGMEFFRKILNFVPLGFLVIDEMDGEKDSHSTRDYVKFTITSIIQIVSAVLFKILPPGYKVLAAIAYALAENIAEIIVSGVEFILKVFNQIGEIIASAIRHAQDKWGIQSYYDDVQTEQEQRWMAQRLVNNSCNYQCSVHITTWDGAGPDATYSIS